MTQIDKIENKIRDLVGGTRELVFGCKVKDISYLDSGEWIFISKLVNGSISVFRNSTGCGIGELNQFEIIGKELTLQDLLITVEKSNKDIHLKILGNNLGFCYEVEDEICGLEYYNLSLSLQDNLKENKELVGLLLKIFEIE